MRLAAPPAPARDARGRLLLPWLVATRDGASGGVSLSFDNATASAMRVVLAPSEAALDERDALSVQLAPFDDASGRRARLPLPPPLLAARRHASLALHCSISCFTPPLRCIVHVKL